MCIYIHTHLYRHIPYTYINCRVPFFLQDDLLGLALG